MTMEEYSNLQMQEEFRVFLVPQSFLSPGEVRDQQELTTLVLLSADIITFQNNRLSAKQEKKQVATGRRKLLSPSVREQGLHRGDRQAQEWVTEEQEVEQSPGVKL